MRGKDLGERIYKMMKLDLMLGKYDNHEMYNEQDFADRYGCSRTPAREAAGRLVLEGFLNKYPSKGYIIRIPSETEVRELRECRYILECSVIDKIVADASDDQIHGLERVNTEDVMDVLYTNNLSFHLDMVRLTGNTKLEQMVESLLYLLVRPLVATRYPSYEDYASRTQGGGRGLTKEHMAIVEALLARDAAKAKELLKEDVYPAKY